jgi:peptidoglycan/LPS O-acetylase OafA/YrhL
MIKRFYVLDSFRGLAAIFVVVYHLHYIDSFTELSFFRGSDKFVEFFFILSGFVLAYNYGFKDNFKFSVFFKSRFFRIFPLHIFMLIVFIVIESGKYLAHKNGFPFNFKPFTDLSAVEEIVPNLFLLQSWLPWANSLSFNYPSWSISVEFYIYMIFAVMIIIFSKKINILLWLSIVLILTVLNSYDFITGAVARGLINFFLGCVIYVFYKNINTNMNLTINKFVASFMEFLLIVTIYFTISIDVDNKDLLVTGIFAITVLFFAFEAGYLSKMLKYRFFLHLGHISYSIYLVHAAIIFCSLAFFIIISKIFNTDFTVMVNEIRYIDLGSATLNNLLLLAFLGVVILISSVTYKYIELRFNYRKTIKSSD